MYEVGDKVLITEDRKIGNYCGQLWEVTNKFEKVFGKVLTIRAVDPSDETYYTTEEFWITADMIVKKVGRAKVKKPVGGQFYG